MNYRTKRLESRYIAWPKTRTSRIKCKEEVGGRKILRRDSWKAVLLFPRKKIELEEERGWSWNSRDLWASRGERERSRIYCPFTLFSARGQDNFVHVQWDTSPVPRPLQISECRQPCDLFSVHSSRLLAAPQQHRPFRELLACRLSPGCGISVSVYSPPLRLSVSPICTGFLASFFLPLSLYFSLLSPI